MNRLDHRPRRLARRAAPALALAIAGLLVSPALADDEGKRGRISKLKINTPGSDEHPSYHGSVTLRLVGSGEMVEYRWGGSSCPGQKLSDAQVDLLMHAFVGRTKMVPTYTMGEGTGTRCLVAFEMVTG